MAPKREKQLQFRCSEEEDRDFRDAADAMDMSLSDYLRKAAKYGSAMLVECKELRSIDLDYVPGAERKP